MNKLMEGKFIFVVRCAIWYHLYNFVQVLKKKKIEKERGGNFPYLFKVAFVMQLSFNKLSVMIRQFSVAD